METYERECICLSRLFMLCSICMYDVIRVMLGCISHRSQCNAMYEITEYRSEKRHFHHLISYDFCLKYETKCCFCYFLLFIQSKNEADKVVDLINACACFGSEHEKINK